MEALIFMVHTPGTELGIWWGSINQRDGEDMVYTGLESLRLRQGDCGFKVRLGYIA